MRKKNYPRGKVAAQISRHGSNTSSTDTVVLLSEVGLLVTDTGDDKGLAIPDGQFSVGSADEGREAVIGEGDSYPVPIAYHCDYSDISGLTITDAVDVTEDLQSDSGSLVNMFDGITTGKCLLIGSDYMFGGVKVKTSTKGVMDSADITMEYLIDDSPTWTNSPYMATNADFPYTQYGNILSPLDSKSEQIRFGFDDPSDVMGWVKVTLTINGTGIEKYWFIMRITTNITTDAVIEQVKMHTNRWECNADGVTEYFGRSRYPKDLHIRKFANADKNPANENITMASGITLIRSDNEFNNGANDGLILGGVLPVGIDTSLAVNVAIGWYQKGTAIGDVELEVEVVKLTAGFILDGSGTKSAPISKITTVDGTAKMLRGSLFNIPIDDMTPGDALVISLYRDASSGNADDTLADNVVFVNGRMVGYFWR